ncbi:MAG: Gfo/Idh/MocA family oxidoreductase [Candidatus Cloacimonetes bacterium]|nr:Gfo/Idh/MocA family oxidoreductase [Candidatus Cloacimonadota bacterium]
MIRIGVVGVGHLGQHHARKFLSIQGCELKGIHDRNPDRAAQISEALGVKSYPTYEDLLTDIDAIDIAATTTWHYALAKTALQAGKHVFLEKPITSELKEAEELVAIAEQKGLIIQVGHIERYNPVILEVEREIKDPMFIESHRISSFQHRGTDVPVVLDLMIHDIDLVLSFIKSPITEIRANGVGIFTSSIDIANARLQFANGAIANVTSSRVALKQERKLRIFQRDKYISLDFQTKHATVIKRSADIARLLPLLMMGNTGIKPEQLVDKTEYDVADSPKDALSTELESFVNCLNQGSRPVVDGTAGMRALQVALEIIQRIQNQDQTHI